MCSYGQVQGQAFGIVFEKYSGWLRLHLLVVGGEGVGEVAIREIAIEAEAHLRNQLNLPRRAGGTYRLSSLIL